MKSSADCQRYLLFSQRSKSLLRVEQRARTHNTVIFLRFGLPFIRVFEASTDVVQSTYKLHFRRFSLYSRRREEGGFTNESDDYRAPQNARVYTDGVEISSN